MKRLIEDRMGAANLNATSYVLDCGRNFRHGIEKLPVVQEAFQCWKVSDAPADLDIRPTS